MVVLLGAPLPPPAPLRPAVAVSRTPRPLVEQPQTPCLSPWVPLSAVLAPPRRRAATGLQTKCAVRWNDRAPRVAGCQAQTGHGCLGQSADNDGISEMAQSRWLSYRGWGVAYLSPLGELASKDEALYSCTVLPRMCVRDGANCPSVLQKQTTFTHLSVRAMAMHKNLSHSMGKLTGAEEMPCTTQLGTSGGGGGGVRRHCLELRTYALGHAPQTIVCCGGHQIAL